MMSTEIKVETKFEVEVAPDVDAKDVSAIVLVPQNLFDVEVCGQKVSAWVKETVSVYDTKIVDIKRGDDIIGIVKENADKKYCIVVYADTPLLKRSTLEQALSFAATGENKVVQLTRGWVFEVEHVKKGEHILSVAMPNLDAEDFLVAYNHSQIATITTYARGRINEKHMENGVFITDPYNVYIDAQVKIGAGTKIGPGVVLRGDTIIGKDCRITNFVEIKKSKIGDGTKISHMSYIGDATIGKNCNIGCGVVFCNYDGEKKHSSTVGDAVFIGSNCNLVAPISIGEKAHIMEGSTITHDVPGDALAMGRAKQAVKENWRNTSPENPTVV